MTHPNRDALLELARRVYAGELETRGAGHTFIRSGADNLWTEAVYPAMLQFAALASRPSPVGGDEVQRVTNAWSAMMREFDGAFGDIDNGYYAEVTEMREAVAALKSQPSSTGGDA